MFKSKLSLDCIKVDIFTSYETSNMLKSTIKKMMMMKPVLLKDFDMLLPTSKKTHEYDVLLKDSFF